MKMTKKRGKKARRVVDDAVFSKNKLGGRENLQRRHYHVRLELMKDWVRPVMSAMMLQHTEERCAVWYLKTAVSISVCVLMFSFSSLSWMQMRRRERNTGFDQTLKRTRHLGVWLITTTRLSTSPLTSMMDVSTHTRAHTETHTHTHTHSYACTPTHKPRW